MLRRTSRRRREYRRRLSFRRKRETKAIFDCRIFTRARLGEDKGTNADFALFSHLTRRVALADGVSRSFHPAAWAEFLVRTLTESDLPLSPSSISTAAEQFAPVNEADLSWPEVALLRRFGSQSTLMVVEFIPETSKEINLRTFAIGDCLLVRANASSRIEEAFLWPYTASADFPAVPGSICTSPPHLRGDTHESVLITASQGDSLFLMTDALGRYFARSREAGLTLKQIFPFLERTNGFDSWSEVAMATGLVDEDDLTLVEIRFT